MKSNLSRHQFKSLFSMSFVAVACVSVLLAGCGGGGTASASYTSGTTPVNDSSGTSGTTDQLVSNPVIPDPVVTDPVVTDPVVTDPVVSIPSMCVSVKYPAPSGSQNDITFNFDKPYECGKFANGDWWVSADSSGYVTVTSISPAVVKTTIANGGTTVYTLNGFEVNPSSTTKIGFGDHIKYWGSSFSSALLPTLPLQVAGTSSLVKMVSIPDYDARPGFKFAAVLTVTSTPVANSSSLFRPGYFGSAKKMYSINDINVSGLPKYSASSLASATSIPFSKIATRYQQVQLDHFQLWAGQHMHPYDNFTNHAYGAEIAGDNATSLLRMLLDDFDYANATHKQALINYLQMAIDLKSIAANGVIWPGSMAGHSNGRKLPLLFAGWILDSSDFDNAIAASRFSEDEQVYISATIGKALFGEAGTDAEYWADIRTGSGSKTVRDPYGYVDGASKSIGGDSYQFCCISKPFKYTALALYMLGLENKWNYPAFTQYVERWVKSGVIAAPDPCAPYDGILANYGVTYGPDGTGSCIKGGGRHPLVNGTQVDGGYYAIAFGDDLWAWYKSTR